MAKRQTKRLPKKQLDYYRELLVEKMREILADVGYMEESVFQGGGDISTMPVHLADVGTDSYEQEFSLGLVAEERKTLIEIQQALARIQNGTFGFCEGLGIPIEENRLEAIPWTRYSLEYARLLETGKAFKNDYLKRRPIDIQRESDDFDDEADEQEDDIDGDLPNADEEELEDEEAMTSLDELEEEEDYDEQEEDIERQRDSA